MSGAERSARIRVGMAQARARGQHVGRPRAAQPDPSSVVELRARGRSWGTVANVLKCSIGAARRAARRAALTAGGSS